MNGYYTNKAIIALQKELKFLKKRAKVLEKKQKEDNISVNTYLRSHLKKISENHWRIAMKVFQAIKMFVMWLLDNRKPILTYVTFITILNAYVRVSIKAESLQDIGPNSVLLMALILGIDMSHNAFKLYNANKNAGSSSSSSITTIQTESASAKDPGDK